MSSGHFENALQCYIKGLQLAPTDLGDMTDMKAKTLRFNLMSNRLDALIKLNRLDGNEHNEALQHIFRHHPRLSDTQASKAFYQCAKFYVHQNDLAQAHWCLARCPSSTSDDDPVNILRTELKRMALQYLADCKVIQRGISKSLKILHSECAICLNDLSDNPSDICDSYPCKHAFHEDCLLRLFRESNKKCPMCRCDLLDGREEA